MNEKALTTVILSNRFYAHMSRTLGLNSRLRLHNANYNGTLETERVLGGLFEAYIAGVYKEYGNARFAELYVWFAGWMRPYFVAISSQITGKPIHSQSLPTSPLCSADTE